MAGRRGSSGSPSVGRQVSVPSVRDSQGHVFGVETLSQEPWPFVPPLGCSQCGTPVKAVSGYTQRRQNGPVQVRPHYSLIDRTTGDHRDDCLYAFDQRVGKIVEEHAHDIEKRGDVHVLHLRERPASLSERLDILTKRIERLEVVTETDWRPLPSTIQAARKIARLLKTFEDDPVARLRFRARWQGTTIPWSHFCFDLQGRLDRILTIAHDDKSTHPIAAYGVVTYPMREALSGGNWMVPLDTGETQPVRAALRSRTRQMIDFPVGTTVLAYGMWGQYTAPKTGRTEVRLWCDHPGSATRLEWD